MDTKEIYLNVLPNLLSLFDYYSSKDMLIARDFLKEEAVERLFLGYLAHFGKQGSKAKTSAQQPVEASQSKSENGQPLKSIRHAHMTPSEPPKEDPLRKEPLVPLSLMASLIMHKLSDEKLLVIWT